MNKYIIDKKKYLTENRIFYLGVFSENEDTSYFKEEDVIVYLGEEPVSFDHYYCTKDKVLKEKTKYLKHKEGSYILQDGEYIETGSEEIKYIEKPISEEPLKWNKKKKKWEVDEKLKEELEKKKLKEIEENYFSTIDKIKEEILTQGFEFQGHRQKCRVKDMTFLNSTIESTIDEIEFNGASEDDVVPWAFNDGDVIMADLRTLKMIRLAGKPFIRKVFTVEQILKAKPAFDVKMSDYLNLMGEIQ